MVVCGELRFGGVNEERGNASQVHSNIVGARQSHGVGRSRANVNPNSESSPPPAVTPPSTPDRVKRVGGLSLVCQAEPTPLVRAALRSSTAKHRPPNQASALAPFIMSCIIDTRNKTWTFLDCSDSDLSISANILGIATFAVALVATYLAFFLDIKDIPTVADDYSNDIRSLHDQLWAIGDIHAQLSKLASNGGIRISDVVLQSRLQQGQAESLKEARKFLDEYSASYQRVFTSYFEKHRWLVRLRWLILQRRVEHFKANASVLRETLTLDLLAVSLNINISLQQELRDRDQKRDIVEEKLDKLELMMGRISPEPRHRRISPDPPDSPSPTAGLNVPGFFVSGPSDDTPEDRTGRSEERRPPISRSPSPLS